MLKYAGNLEQGTFLPLPPVLVHYQSKVILDGHHRIKAIQDFFNKHAELPALYVMFTDLSPEQIARLNHVGKTWGAKNYLSFYAKLHYPHYEYLSNALTELQALQRKLLLVNSMPTQQLSLLLQGYSASAESVMTKRNQSKDLFTTGGMRILLKKEFLITCLETLKQIELVPDYNWLLHTGRYFKPALFTFLMAVCVRGFDMDAVADKIVRNKHLPKMLREAWHEKQDIKEVLFDSLGVRLTKPCKNFAALWLTFKSLLHTGAFQPDELRGV